MAKKGNQNSFSENKDLQMYRIKLVVKWNVGPCSF